MRIRYLLAAGALAVAATTAPVAAHAAKYGKWSVDYDPTTDSCYMRANFEDGGATITFDLTIDYDGNELLSVYDSRWTMPQQSTSAEIWYTRDWKRSADVTRKGLLHNEGGKTHLDVALQASDLSRLEQTDWIIIRPADGGLFVQYNLGATKPAIDALWSCDEEWDNYW
jgi:hypothetical protein